MSRRKQRPERGGCLPQNPSERDIAAFTGMSRRQIWQAKKIAEIPVEEFEALIESDNPPTVTELLNVAHQRATPGGANVPALRREVDVSRNVVPLRPAVPMMRNVLRGPERDAAVRAAAAWYRQHADTDLNTIADRFNISLTAAAEAVLVAGRDADA